ncbi:hypothetical protein [Halobacteriovorax sp. DA5]|uniref:hypothetical protein n=1 Tax=Halobacteriovorax sp. DA5 TaxID=2067553 RepID=UPI000CD0CC62|nr:hypothetical protein [Halobacteriovorax sp. DA5]POB15137.1 hypothetical protein C0Z22_01785 [Halobacteriovorax sp. DA5]
MVYCGHETMIGRKIVARVEHAGSITKGRTYTVIDELWRGDSDLERVTVKSDDNLNYDLYEGEFS